MTKGKSFLIFLLIMFLLSGCAQQKEELTSTIPTLQETTTTETASTIPASTTTTTTPESLVTRTTTTTRSCTIPTIQECHDSDGYDIYKKGTVSGRLNIYLSDYNDPRHYDLVDINETCVNPSTVTEYTCEVKDCNLLLVNNTVYCPSGYACIDGACTNATTTTLLKSVRYGEVKAELSLNKPVYKSGERMDITIKINSPKKMDVDVNLYGIFARYYRMNKTQSIVLEPGPNTISFTYTTPPCNQCAGVAAGTYVITAEVLYNDDLVAKVMKNVELKQ